MSCNKFDATYLAQEQAPQGSHQQSTLKKGMQKLQTAKAMMEATEECDVMSFDQANQEWKECVQKLVEDMASSSMEEGSAGC